MSKLTLTIDMDGAAFEGYAGDEIAGILRKLVTKIEPIGDRSNMDVIDGTALTDSNGNTVGKLEVTL